MRTILQPCPKQTEGPAQASVSAELVHRLNKAGVRYGVYKNKRLLDAALSGDTDLDLLVAAEDVERFRSIVVELGGISGRPFRLHDNAGLGREDWFVPDFAAADYIHLDVSAGLRVGPKFRKRHLALSYDDVAEWQTPAAHLPIPVVSAEDEARIAVLRMLFRLQLRGRSPWVRLDDECSRLVAEALRDQGAGEPLRFRVGSDEVVCAIRTERGAVELDKLALRRLRDLIRRSSGGSKTAEDFDVLIHHLRRSIYFAARLLTRSSPALTVNKRAAGGGFLIALVGPDAVGKSTQVQRLTSIFQKKFRSTSVYLGSGEGGWKLRQFVRRQYEGRRSRLRTGLASRDSVQSGRGLGHALWWAVTGMERYLALHAARHLAAWGAIVITDRWPQNLQAGLLDGPHHLPATASRSARFLVGIEQSFYRVMARHRPDLTIHLTTDFETSHARKPGDIDRPDFESRLALMREMRIRDPQIKLVDAREGLDEVTRKLFRHVWFELRYRTRATTEPRVEPLGIVASQP